MEQHEFQTRIRDLLGQVEPAATQAWLDYAKELELDGVESSDLFFREVLGELELIKHVYGEGIAAQLYHAGREFTCNPFELRKAAEHLKAGMSMQAVCQLAVEGDFFTLPRKYYKPEVTVTLPYEERWFEALRAELGEERVLQYLTSTLDNMALSLLPEGLFQKVTGEMEAELRFRAEWEGNPASAPSKKKRRPDYER